MKTTVVKPHQVMAKNSYRPEITDFNRLPDNANISVKDASLLTGLGISTVWSKSKTGNFPQPKRYGSRTFWKMGDIREWLNSAGC